LLWIDPSTTLRLVGTRVNQQSIIEDLARLVPELPDPARLLPLLSVVPIPNPESLLPLLKSLARVARRVTWIEQLSVQDWPSRKTIQALLTEAQVYQSRFHQPQDPQLSGIQGDYPTYSSLLDNLAKPPMAREQLRAILVFCAARWSPAGAHVTAIDTIASAVRGMVKGIGSLSTALSNLGNPDDLHQLATAADGLNLDCHDGLREIWWDRVVPELRGPKGELRSPPPPPSRPPPSPPPPSPAPPPPAAKKNRHRKSRKLRKPRVIRVRATNTPPTVHVRAEAPEDNSGSELLADVPTRKRSLAGLSRDLFLAKQTIWSANSLLLTENFESLGASEAFHAGRALIVEGDKLLAAARPVEARQLSSLALSLATGRAAKALSNMGKRGLRNDDFTWSCDIEHGEIKQSVLRPESSFAPDSSEQEWLEPTTVKMSLIVAPELAAYLRRIAAASVPLLGSNAVEIEKDLRAACVHMSEVTGLRLTPGRVRRSLACLLQNEGRDLAATVLITGDTQGLSTAPLYYYAPQELDLQRLYGKVTAGIFGGDEPTPTASPGKRIGSRLLVDGKVRHQFARSLGAALHGKNALKPTCDSAVVTHNAVVNHTIGMILGTAGHRPVDALFGLIRTSVDTYGSCALFEDKRVDIAHETRFAALPTVLREQINAYVDHLWGLIPLVPKFTRTFVESVLSGDSPLLFSLAPDGRPMPLTIADWVAQAPPAWRTLPQNHGRTTIATRGREAGARPEALAIQLGHLEAVGFPFSKDGATVPILMAAELAPVLDRVARDGGWKVKSGYQSAQAEDIWKTFGPLPDWRKKISQHEAKQKEAMRKLASAQRAEVRTHRLRGEEWACEALGKTCPVIVHALQLKELPEDGSQLEHLGPDEVVALQESLQARADGDLVANLAAMNALRRLLLRLKKEFHWTGYIPFAWRKFHRSETTPFFPGMMLARIQIETLRSHFESIPTTPPEPVSTWDWQCARVALALCLFGFVDDPEQVIGVLEHASHARRCTRLPDLLLVPWRNEPCEVAGFRGLAAIAVTALAKISGRHQSKESAEGIDLALRSMLPPGACSPRMKVLDRLCSMTAVANRIELSGAARTALAEVTSAAISQQQAWIDGDPVVNAASSLGEVMAQRSSPSIETVRVKRGDSRRQYRALLELFPSTEHDTVLPRTGVVIKPTQAESARNRVVAEMRALVKDETTNAVVMALALWAIKMLTVGTLSESNPAYGTILTYLTTVGSDLVSLTESYALSDFDEAELAQIYLDVVEMKTPRGQPLAAREILHFHASVANLIDLPEIDPSELETYLGKAESHVDAELILPQEWDFAVERVAMLCTQGGDEFARTPEQRRLLRQTKLLLEVIGAAGPRSGEPLGMRLDDLIFAGQLIMAAFVPNRHRRIKTRAGQRVIDLSHLLDDAAQQDMRAWVAAERARLTESMQRKGYLFSSPDSALDVSPKSPVKHLASLVLGVATGRARERLHRGRHMALGQGLMWYALSSAERARIPFLQSLAPAAQGDAGVKFPRDLQRQVAVVGHRRALTSIRAYLHFNWLLRSQSDRWIQQRVNRRTAAVAMGVSVFRADQLRLQKKGKDEAQAWLDNGVKPREARPALVGETLPRPPLDVRQISILDVGRLLGWVEQGIEPDAAALSLGVSNAQLNLLNQAVAEYSSQVGRDFHSRGKGHAVSRRISSAAHLYKLWQVEQDGGEGDLRSLSAIARALYSVSRPTDKDTLVLPAREAYLLKQLLIDCGHESGLIELNDHPKRPALSTMRIRRSSTSRNYAGLELKRIFGVIWVRNRLAELAT
jgi:hypothetical protein